MRKLWIKFSDERNKRYSIKTTIYQDENTGKKHVTKEAIFPEGVAHLKDMVEYYNATQTVFVNSRMCPVELKHNTLWFEFIDGESLEDKYRKAFREKDEILFCKLLKHHLSLIKGNEKNECVFSNSPDFESVFGVGDEFDSLPGLKIANFDAIASNIIFTDDSDPTFIDYEWLFLTPLPKDLVIFHCIQNLYFHIQGLEEFYSLDKAMDYLNVTIPKEALERACNQFFHYVITEPDGYSFAGTKQVCLKGETDVQYYIEDAKKAHEGWKECADNWKSTVKAYDDLQKTCNDIERFWKQSSQANNQLNNELQEIKRSLEERNNELQIEHQYSQQWKQAYETVINSKTWRTANKLKKVLGRGQ